MCLHEYMGVNLSILVCQYMCIHVYVSFYPKAWCICHNVNIRVCLKIKPCRIDENRQTMFFSRKSKPLNKIIYNNTIHGSSLGFKLASYTWFKKILQTSAYLIKPRLGNQWFDFLLVKGSLYIYIYICVWWVYMPQAHPKHPAVCDPTCKGKPYYTHNFPGKWQKQKQRNTHVLYLVPLFVY